MTGYEYTGDTYPRGYAHMNRGLTIYFASNIDCTSEFERRPEPMRIFGRWVEWEIYLDIMRRCIKASWEAIAKIKYHARSVFVDVRRFEIFQPVWSADRWRSLT
jgi:hypothetical protein